MFYTLQLAETLGTDLKEIPASPGKGNLKIGIVIFSASCLSAMLVLRYYSDDFNVVTLDHLFFSLLALVTTLFWPLFLYQRIKEGMVIRLALFDLTAAVLALYMFLSGFLANGAPVVYTKPLFYLLFYGIARCLIFTNESADAVNKAIYWGLILYMIFLIFLWIQNGNMKVFIVGAFNNANENAGFVSMLLPLILAQIRPWKLCRFNSFLPLVVLVLALCIVILSASRTAWLATLVMACYYLFLRTRRVSLMKKYIVLLWTIIIAGITLLAIGLYCFKPASMQGRYLIYKISAKMLANDPFVGIGYGKYQAEFNDFQAEYFRVNPAEPLKYLADNNYSPFNEALGIGVELGAVGLVLSFLLLLSLLSPCGRFSKTNSLLPSAWYTLVAVLVCALFNYPFSATAVNVITILSAAQLNFYFRNYIDSRIVIGKYHKAGLVIFWILIFATMLVLGYILVQVHRASYIWREAMAYSLKDDRKRASITYQMARVWLHNDGRFLYNYGAELSVWGANEESIVVLNKARTRYTSSSLYTYLGDGYLNTDQHYLAARAYRHAANMVPSKLYPKYKLLKLYQLTGQKKAAQEVAFEINTTPVKAPSQIVREIRAEANKFIESNRNDSTIK